MKRLLVFIFLMLICIPVHAKEETFYYDDEKVENMWVTKVGEEKTMSSRLHFIKARSDNTYGYCLEPFILLENDSKYVIDNDYTKYGLTKEQMDRINLILYYGYGYDNHKDDIWYGVTQYLVWKEVDKKSDIYFTNEKNGVKKDLYINEINDIERLIKEHNIEPDFIREYRVSKDSELVIPSNIDLDDYDITTNVKYSIDNNKLIIDTSLSGDYKIVLKKKNNRFNNNYLLYRSEESQDIIIPGNSDIYSKEYSFNINVLEGRLVLEKVSSFDNSKLVGAKYGVYKNDLLIKELVTDNNGLSEIKLPFGEYYLKEIEAPSGYKLDNNKYKFTIDINNLDIKLRLEDDKEIVEVPNTGLKSKKYSSLFFIIIGIVLLLYGKKEHKVY